MTIVESLRRNAARKSELDADKSLLANAASEIDGLQVALRSIINCYVERFEGNVVGLASGVELDRPYRIAKAALGHD